MIMYILSKDFLVFQMVIFFGIIPFRLVNYPLQ